MKFRTETNKQLFIVDNNLNLTLEQLDKLNEREFQGIIKKADRIKFKATNYKRSQATKQSWKENRYKYMKGIKRFHDSTEGKRFHRALGRFLSTRDLTRGFISTAAGGNEEYEKDKEKFEFVRALNSALSHCLIELDFYESLNEDVEYLLFAEDFIEVVAEIMNGNYSKECIDFLKLCIIGEKEDKKDNEQSKGN